MSARANSSGVKLTESDAAMVKGMILRGDRQHDIASWFGVNGGRISEIASGHRFRYVAAAAFDKLPPSGPYSSDKAQLISALAVARQAIAQAEQRLRGG